MSAKCERFNVQGCAGLDRTGGDRDVGL